MWWDEEHLFALSTLAEMGLLENLFLYTATWSNSCRVINLQFITCWIVKKYEEFNLFDFGWRELCASMRRGIRNWRGERSYSDSSVEVRCTSHAGSDILNTESNIIGYGSSHFLSPIRFGALIAFQFSEICHLNNFGNLWSSDVTEFYSNLQLTVLFSTEVIHIGTNISCAVCHQRSLQSCEPPSQQGRTMLYWSHRV